MAAPACSKACFCRALYLHGMVEVVLPSRKHGKSGTYYLPKDVFGADYMLCTNACDNGHTKIIICFVYASLMSSICMAYDNLRYTGYGMYMQGIYIAYDMVKGSM
jgi:hypothetical protein